MAFHMSDRICQENHVGCDYFGEEQCVDLANQAISIRYCGCKRCNNCQNDRCVHPDRRRNEIYSSEKARDEQTSSINEALTIETRQFYNTAIAVDRLLMSEIPNCLIFWRTWEILRWK